MSLLIEQTPQERAAAGVSQAGHPLTPLQSHLPLAPVYEPRKRRSSLGSLVKVSTAAGVAVVVAAVVVEHTAPPQWRPSTVVGAFGGHVQAAEWIESIDAMRAVTAVQQEENARALQEVEQFRGLQERITVAYKAEFDRGTQLVTASANAAVEVLRHNAQAQIAAMEGMQWEANTSDKLAALCRLIRGFGGPDCVQPFEENGTARRMKMVAEINENFFRQRAALQVFLNSWADGLLSPQQLVEQLQGDTRLRIPERQPVPASPARSS